MGYESIYEVEKIFAKMFPPISSRHMSAILITFLLSAIIFLGIVAAERTDEEFAVNETQFIPPPAGDGSMAGGSMPLDNGTMTDRVFDPANLPEGTSNSDVTPTEATESPLPIFGILAGLSAVVFFSTRRS